jgi:SAM-dependent methyltransferase
LSSGVDSFGVEASREMARRARARLTAVSSDDAARVVSGDARTLPFSAGRFAAVIAPFNFLMDLLSAEDCAQVLREVRRVLASGGLFATDVAVPDPTWLAETRPTWRLGHRFRFEGADLESWTVQRHYDPVTQRSEREVAYTVAGQDGPTSPRFALSYTVRNVFPDEVVALCEAAGLSVVERLGDFSRPFDGTATSLVVVARSVERP